jgi:hypothetical protein
MGDEDSGDNLRYLRRNARIWWPPVPTRGVALPAFYHAGWLGRVHGTNARWTMTISVTIFEIFGGISGLGGRPFRPAGLATGSPPAGGKLAEFLRSSSRNHATTT